MLKGPIGFHHQKQMPLHSAVAMEARVIIIPQLLLSLLPAGFTDGDIGLWSCWSKQDVWTASVYMDALQMMSTSGFHGLVNFPLVAALGQKLTYPNTIVLVSISKSESSIKSIFAWL